MLDKYWFSTDKIDKQDGVTPMPVSYHVVLPTCTREDLFRSSRTCNYLAYLIFETSVLHKYNLYAFCIMPDHVHILCKPGNVLIDQFVDLLRLRFEYILLKDVCKRSVRQSDFKGYSLPDEELKDVACFIFENPVRNGLVDDAKDYPYSFVYGEKMYRP